MAQTDILKLIFHHDQRMETLAPSPVKKEEDPLAAFTKPDPTYSTLYFSGTDLDGQRFGLNSLEEFEAIMNALAEGFGTTTFYTEKERFHDFKKAIESTEVESVIVVSNEEVDTSLVRKFNNSELREVLEKGWIVIYKKKAKDGYDLFILSKQNLYLDFFYPLKSLLPNAFRFFSINGKRVISEKFQYFETWRLDKPPHGFEEVFVESVL
ncbi:MAG: hypothetical protein RLN81_15440 [Balneolaceae bacterium]